MKVEIIVDENIKDTIIKIYTNNYNSDLVISIFIGKIIISVLSYLDGKT